MNSKGVTRAAKYHMRWIKEQSCIVCGLEGPSDCHHIDQGQHFTTLPLCKECHQGVHNGWHGRKAAWAVRKLDEMKALNLLIATWTIQYD